MTGCTARRYDQFETSPEAIEQELRPAVCERRQTRLKANYSIDGMTIANMIIQKTVAGALQFYTKHSPNV